MNHCFAINLLDLLIRHSGAITSARRSHSRNGARWRSGGCG
jgi:hypothetical protein